MLQRVTEINGEKVLLRPPRPGDAEESARVWTPQLRHMYGGSLTAGDRPTVEDRRQRLERLARGEEGHFFCLEAGGRYIGFAILGRFDGPSRSARYRIGIENPEYWGKGYGAEVTRLMLRYAFETLGLHRVSLRVAAYNVRAIRCYEKCGFRHEGLERDSFLVDGKWHDDVLMAVRRPEWEACVGARPAHGVVSVRSYRRNDCEQVGALWESVGFTLGASDDPEVLAEKVALDRGPFLVAEEEGRVVGTVMGHLDRRWGWINRLAVRPDCQRRGIGRLLMQEIEKSLASAGACRLSLLTHKDNEQAKALYHSLGYESWDEHVSVMGKRLEAEEECGGGQRPRNTG